MVTVWSILITGKDKFSYKRKGPGMYRLERTLSPDDYRETFLKAKSQYMAEHPIPWDVHFREGKCTKPQLQGWAKDFYYPQKCAKGGIFCPASEEKQRSVICKFENFEATASDRPCVTPPGTPAGSDNRGEA